jgi:ATP-dependent DNA helicase
MSKLRFVLERSRVYSEFLRRQMDEDKARQQAELALRREERDKEAASSRKRGRVSASAPSKRRRNNQGEPVQPHDKQDDIDQPPIFPQPSLVTGAKLKGYQLEGLQWMTSLHQNGISGILGML